MKNNEHKDRNLIPVEIIYVDPRFHSDKPEDEKFVKLTYGTEGSAAVDIVACIDEPITLRPGERLKMSTGIKMWLNDVNSGAFMLPRSGIGSSHGIVLANLVALIDSDFQGVMQIPVWNANPQVVWDDELSCVRYNREAEFVISPGDRICQMTLVSIMHGDYSEVTAFSEITQRGEGGLGSTKGIAAVDPTKVYHEQTVTTVEVFQYSDSPVDDCIRLHGSVGDNPIWFDVLKCEKSAIEELSLPCVVTFTHCVDGETKITFEQTDGCKDFNIATDQGTHQIVFLNEETNRFNYRVASTNMMCSIHISHIDDFSLPSSVESSLFNINIHETGLVKLNYLPQ